MIVTPFGDLDFDDEVAMRHWMAAHDARHRTYTVALLRRGIVIQSPPLSDRFNAHWRFVHWANHSALAKQLIPSSSGQQFGLSVDPLDGEQEFYNWHHAHNLSHQLLDQALGVVSV